ncbi:Rho-related GTP-binding protein RhoC [Araneus ventricosus]|uniref:Rho-related GTP-binding protein RhoC n=1 Tax=Araneus ventricosus TaxID=182803 RepID=A0A4Y2PVS1_ARAVE|nr:Rho-related GTP-binding protein RhoC [Araneus ventricosus]
MAMRSIKKDNDGSPSILGEDVVKVVVIGEPQVGKTSFIRAFYQHHEPGPRYSHNGVDVYICEFKVNGTCKRAAIFEIPGDAGFFHEQRPPHYEDAKVIVLMYAIDDPLSLELLTDKWLPEASQMVSSDGIPVVLVGNKKDLRDDQYVIARFDLNDETPVTYEQGEDLLVHERIKYFAEISTDNLEEVNAAFDLIFSFALYED